LTSQTSGQDLEEISDEEPLARSIENTMAAIPSIPLPKIPQCETPAEIEGFIKKYTIYVRIAHLAPEDALERFSFCLRGQVDNDYQAYWQDRNPETLEEAFESLRATCGITKLPFNRWVMQFHLEQKQGESIDEYMTRFRQEQRKAQGNSNEGMLVQLFIKSLLPRISTKVFDADPPTLRQAIEDARKAEQSVTFQDERWKQDKAARTAAAVPRRPLGPTMALTAAPGQIPGGAFRRPFTPNRPTFMGNMNRKANVPVTTAQEKQEDPEIDQLRQQLANMTIGSIQHQQLKEKAMQTGRCLICLSKTHQARMCPQRTYPAFAITEGEEEEQEENEDNGVWIDYEESDPEWAQ